DLASSTHVFLREEMLRGTFHPSYSGPHEVLQHGDKVFKILVKGKAMTVSIDRLKPAYILSTASPSLELTPDPEPRPTEGTKAQICTTRSGRQVRFTDFYRP
ncbi:Uncharacterized protein OBRU01_25987, partial [Operophtera brumata]